MTDSDKQDDEMNCGLSVAERDILFTELHAMPDTMPPRVVWQRISEQARAEGLIGGSGQLERMKWLAGAAIAATVAMLALNLPFGDSPVDPGDGAFSNTPAAMETSGPRDLNALKVESQLLERNLRQMPEQPSVMRVSTAKTIQDLEDRIAAIDYRLNDRTVRLDPRQEEIYWRERVRLMNSLVRLRYAQAQRISF